MDLNPQKNQTFITHEYITELVLPGGKESNLYTIITLKIIFLHF